MHIGSSWKGMVRSSGGSMRVQWTTLILRLSVHSPVYFCWLLVFYHLHLIISTWFGFVPVRLCWFHLILDEIFNGVAMQTMRRKWNECIQLKMEGVYFIDVNMCRLCYCRFLNKPWVVRRSWCFTRGWASESHWSDYYWTWFWCYCSQVFCWEN